MTTYYIDNRDITFACTIASQQLEIGLTGTIYSDTECTQTVSTPLDLGCDDTVEDVDDDDGDCTLRFDAEEVSGWSLAFQLKDGSTWGPDHDSLVIDSNEGRVEWRVHASQSGVGDLYSDPFIRVIKAQSSGRVQMTIARHRS
ncbi:MAG: hypothetical protein KDK70_08645 [Myxococcales bacterium]|nr:hypothetical protein [Myxococcales bacterium]